MARLPLISIWGAKSGDGKTVLAFALCGIAPNNSTSKQSVTGRARPQFRIERRSSKATS
jgi:hypothetical protein